MFKDYLEVFIWEFQLEWMETMATTVPGWITEQLRGRNPPL